MYVLGLTGSIAMGKSWGAQCFRHFGVPVHDADECVHRLLGAGGGAVEKVMAAFPGMGTVAGGVNRLMLADEVFKDTAALNTLEAILHPMVRDSQRRFLARHARAASPLVVLDVPLLFETGGRARVDAVVVMSAPSFLQRRRALKRPGMTAAKFEALLARQTPDDVKRRVAEFLVSTAGLRAQSLRAIGAVVKLTHGRRGEVWGPGWGR
jgi:dephospho-CoA kinase